MGKMNVLLIMTDQHRFDCLEYYGNEVIEKRSFKIAEGDNVISQKGKPSFVSPKHEERLRKSGFDWMKLCGAGGYHIL